MNSRLLGVGMLVPILIVSMGIYIYNTASTTITDSISSFSTQEVEFFNNQFTSFEGKQTGGNTKALIGRLIANADTYKDESSKVPQVYIDQISENVVESMEVTYTEDDNEDNNEYINNLGKIRNGLETKHEYYIEMTYQSNGLIDYIQISYDVENPNLEYKYRQN